MQEYNIMYRCDQAEDYDLWMQFANCSKLASIPAVLMHWRQHGSQSSKINKDRMQQVALAIQASQLRALGMAPEMTSWRCIDPLALDRIQTSAEYVGRVEKWLLKIHSANVSAHIYDEQALSRALAVNWFRVCRHGRAWGKLAFSPLSRMISAGDLWYAARAKKEIITSRLFGAYGGGGF